MRGDANVQVEAVCKDCGNQFTYTPFIFLSGKRYDSSSCSPCMEKRQREQEAAERLARLEQSWEVICPPLYLATDPNHPRIDQKILKGLLKWRPGSDGKGLGLVGPTGRCKTRMSFLVLRGLHFGGYHVSAITAPKFASKCGLLFDDNNATKKEARCLLNRLQSAGILFLDDLGKGPMTPRVEAEFFDLIETRTAYLRPTIWTANASSRDLARIMSKDRGAPIIRRLKEQSRLFQV